MVETIDLEQMEKTSVRMTEDEYERYQKIKQDAEAKGLPAPAPGAESFDFSDYDFSNAGQQVKKVQQPKWKWSYDGKNLLIWPVDEKYGQPHHIEMTGLNFYQLAQGRVYVDPDGTMEITVWEDRGTEEMQDDAIDAVDEWLEQNVGKPAEYYSFHSEGGVYPNLDPTNPDMDKMMTAYFGYPVKVKKNNDGSITSMPLEDDGSAFD